MSIENIILNNIKPGRENSISRDKLVSMTGINDRTIRDTIADLRASGVPIISNTQEGGYYLPSTKDEAQEYIESMESRAKKIFISAKATKQWLKDNGYFEQQELF